MSNRPRAPQAHVSHQMPGRLRLKVPARRRDCDYFADVLEGLSQWPAARRVAVNPVTASVLVEHRGDLAALSRFAERQGLFAVPAGPEPTVPVAGRIRRELTDVDERLRLIAGGALDLWSATSLVFIVLAVVQLARGNYMGPATTLIWAGVSAMRQARTEPNLAPPQG
ncbi:MAG: hypothetical protein EA405_06845 [Rhodospirillales bacterium]|nr:MAG: hypothetical protein EA405_06845 [Rhodospirillales bacterium]